jgi:CRISPR-associated exonuclease Cas4
VLRIPQNEHKFHKVLKGRQIHEDQQEKNKKYLRKKIGVKQKYIGQYLTNGFLRGEMDEVLKLSDDTMAPLDYKFAVYKDRIFETYKTQLYCYSWLIEDNWNLPVHKAFLVYTRSKYKLIEIPVKEEDKDRVKKATEEIQKIIVRNFYPRATRFKKRCITCTYKNICIQ